MMFMQCGSQPAQEETSSESIIVRPHCACTSCLCKADEAHRTTRRHGRNSKGEKIKTCAKGKHRSKQAKKSRGSHDKAVLGKDNRGGKGNPRTRSDRIRRETQGNKAMEPIRPSGLVKGPRQIYHQEEGPDAPEGLP